HAPHAAAHVAPGAAPGAAAVRSAAHPTGPGRPGWVASWTAGPMSGTSSSQATAGFDDQTVRNIIYPSVGGDALRVQLSNTFGSSPLTIGAVSVGVVLDGAQLAPGTSHFVSFGGRGSVTIPAGQQVVSDPLRVRVAPLQDLAISVYLPDKTGPATNHLQAQQTSYIGSGNLAGETDATGYSTTTGSVFFADGLDVESATADGTVVAFGDSITDGVGSLTGGDARWPNYLARRLDAVLGDRAPGVVDEGIGGNRVLRGSSCYGVSALARFKRDALSQPGVKAVILLEGINDIGFAGEPDTGCYAPNNPSVTAAQIEAGYRKLIAMAHARGVKVYGGTLTPFGGSNHAFGGYYGDAHGEAMREQVNTWIKTSGAFDGVVDFAAATADPIDPTYLDPAENSGDSVHPGDVGYEAMANAIPLDFVG
ncbi:MAG: SGNH/GDSL hydrolase family protein, partial [Nocardiopsaceae bacterium]|nr:SGNH/GDSL hydrolase family protein [Nocardiopsaceae bacterium]